MCLFFFFLPFFAFSSLVLIGASFSDEQVLVRRQNKKKTSVQYSSTNKCLYIFNILIWVKNNNSDVKRATAPFLCLSRGSLLLVSASGEWKHIKQYKISFQIKTCMIIFRFSQLKINFQTLPLYSVCWHNENIVSKCTIKDI